MRNIILQESYAKYDGETSPRLFLFFCEKLSLMDGSICFISGRRLRRFVTSL